MVTSFREPGWSVSSRDFSRKARGPCPSTTSRESKLPPCERCDAAEMSAIATELKLPEKNCSLFLLQAAKASGEWRKRYYRAFLITSSMRAPASCATICRIQRAFELKLQLLALPPRRCWKKPATQDQRPACLWLASNLWPMTSIERAGCGRPQTTCALLAGCDSQARLFAGHFLSVGASPGCCMNTPDCCGHRRALSPSHLYSVEPAPPCGWLRSAEPLMRACWKESGKAFSNMEIRPVLPRYSSALWISTITLVAPSLDSQRLPSATGNSPT